MIAVWWYILLPIAVFSMSFVCRYCCLLAEKKEAEEQIRRREQAQIPMQVPNLPYDHHHPSVINDRPPIYSPPGMTNQGYMHYPGDVIYPPYETGLVPPPSYNEAIAEQPYIPGGYATTNTSTTYQPNITPLTPLAPVHTQQTAPPPAATVVPTIQITAADDTPVTRY